MPTPHDELGLLYTKHINMYVVGAGDINLPIYTDVDVTTIAGTYHRPRVDRVNRTWADYTHMLDTYRPHCRPEMRGDPVVLLLTLLEQVATVKPCKRCFPG